MGAGKPSIIPPTCRKAATLGPWLARFRAHPGRSMTPSTRAQYVRLVRRYADYRVAHPEGSLTSSVRDFLGTLTLSVGHTAWLALRRALPETVDWTTIPHPRPKRNEPVLQATLLSDDERAALRRVFAGPRERCLFELFWVLRRIEVTRARWADVDLTKGMIAVPQGKGDLPGWTVLPEPTQLALYDWFVAAGQPPDEALIFPGRFPGRPMNAGSVSHIVRRVLARAGIARRWRGAHAFRRTLATAYLRENPQDIRGLQKILRHRSIVTTTLYDYAQPEELKPRIARLRL